MLDGASAYILRPLVVLCFLTLDHGMLEFFGLVIATGWLRRRVKTSMRPPCEASVGSSWF